MKRNNEALAWLWSGLFGVLTSAFFIFGYQLETKDHIDLSDRNVLMILLVMFLVITFDTRHVFRGYDYSRENGTKLFGFIPLPKPFEETAVTHRDFMINHVSMILLGLPVLLAEFPGFFVYDAQEELNEVLTRSFSTHHPLLHVLLLGGTIALFHKISGSWNIGIFVYILLQLIVITAVFAYVLTCLQRRGLGKKLRILWIIFYGAFPTIVMYSLCSCKDGLFSALLLLITVLLVELVKDTKGFLADKRKVVLFVISSVLMPLFRHNGFYAYLVFVPFALVYFLKRKKVKERFVSAPMNSFTDKDNEPSGSDKKNAISADDNKRLLALMLVLPVVIYLVLSNILGLALSSEVTHHQEMLTVPIMQLARVYSYDGDSLSPEDKAVIESYIPPQNLAKYTPRLSDLVKVDFNNELYEENSADFWRVWKKLLVSHPAAYFNAWLLTCYGYVYPPAAFNVYKGNSVYTFTYDESSYFGYEVEPPGERKSFIPAIDSLYRYLSLGPMYREHPVLYLFFAPGLYLLIYMFVFAYRLSKKRFGAVLPFLPMILCFCTVLLGPTYLIRYVLYLWLCFPLLLL